MADIQGYIQKEFDDARPHAQSGFGPSSSDIERPDWKQMWNSATISKEKCLTTDGLDECKN